MKIAAMVCIDIDACCEESARRIFYDRVESINGDVITDLEIEG